MVKKYRAFFGSSIAPSFKVSTNPWIEVRGVRSSWETLATNSDRIFSNFLISVISFKTTTAPQTLFFSVRGLAEA